MNTSIIVNTQFTNAVLNIILQEPFVKADRIFMFCSCRYEFLHYMKLFKETLKVWPVICSPLASSKLVWWDWFSGAGLGVRVVRGSSWPFLRVLLFAPFRATVLEPHLLKITTI